MSLKQYYGSKGFYLEEHKEYFSLKQLKKDVDFIIEVLKLKKMDKILDIACGNGRHTIELKKRGFDIEGLDFSDYLIKIAKKQAKQENLEINFYKQDIHKIIRKKYNKIFLFFSEFGLFDANKVLKNIARILENKGLFLLDCDNVFRLIKRLRENQDSPYKFDFIKMELKAKKNGNKRVKYYTFPELKKIFSKNKLFIISVYGNYDKEELNINSSRIIIVAKKK